MTSNMLPYIILGIIIFYFLIMAYIRITFKFWYYQPVFHIYNLFYWFHPPGIIIDEPLMNKFCNFQNITVAPYKEVSEIRLKQMANFIQQYYLQAKDAIYHPTYEHIIPYLKGHNFDSFISFYTQPKTLMDYKNKDRIKEDEILGLMTTRPLYVTLEKETFPVYYADYLCIHPDHRKKGIAPEIIQSHLYKQMKANKNIKVSFFKRETNLTGIIPLTLYTTWVFDVKQLPMKQTVTFPLTILEINKQNLSVIFSCIKRMKDSFTCTITPHLSNLCELIMSNNITIYTVLQGPRTIGIYFYRNSTTKYENGEAIECFGSVMEDKDEDLFIFGFIESCRKAIKKYDAKYLQVEDISHNHHILKRWGVMGKEKKIKPYFASPTAFFFYNYGTRPIKSHNILAIY